ncbi:type I methionyl aminopeptidase [Auraticoccus sp. F435]|uniref:Methionine aminopeptidase n=1 Tax=Auraticoccus cholistanensis TaxID=2656650 RepID=A0A6A9UY67_9ACTN|nr:type I methionyl aminopeptidase [Auraticoccus cholistanensis]MVA76732.1 type I methionyl aminopeptidase [Auraticoccus cholistanensis]
MVELHSPRTVERMRPAGEFVAQTLAELRESVGVGTNLLEIDARVEELVRRRGAVSCYVDYHPSFGASPFGHYICTSVNDAALHGLPHDYALAAGDLLTLDLAVAVDGWVADAAVTFSVGGRSTPEDERLVRATEQALEAAIDAARSGRRIGDVSAAIAEVAATYGYPVNDQFGGHGVGRTMHQEPHVPNTGQRGRGMVLKPGLVIAVEPWFMAGTDELVVDPDGWTLRSADGSRAAHSEHTIAVTRGEALVLTRPV